MSVILATQEEAEAGVLQVWGQSAKSQGGPISKKKKFKQKCWGHKSSGRVLV
jgi:hypothetical protein